LPKTYEFKPFINADFSVDDRDGDFIYLDTKLVIVAPEKPIPYDEMEEMGMDKFLIHVARPDNLEKHYEVLGEFGGAHDWGGIHYIQMSIYCMNKVSEQLRDMCVFVPHDFVWEIRTRCV
jgi:hypothetical protein